MRARYYYCQERESAINEGDSCSPSAALTLLEERLVITKETMNVT
jgi:hypothetical protein